MPNLFGMYRIEVNLTDQSGKVSEMMSENSLDGRLVNLLAQNARMGASELARKLGVSRSTINSRLQKLESSGVIKGYTLIFDESWLAKLISAHVLIQVNQKLTVRTNKELAAIPQIGAVYAISGEYDLIAEVRAGTTVELNQVLDSIASLTGVERTNSSVILETRFKRTASRSQ